MLFRSIGFLVDLWGERPSLPALVDHALARFGDMGVDGVHVYATHGELAEILKRRRFYPRASTLRLLYLLKPGVEIPTALLADAPGWWVTLGDSDMDPPS